MLVGQSNQKIVHLECRGSNRFRLTITKLIFPVFQNNSFLSVVLIPQDGITIGEELEFMATRNYLLSVMIMIMKHGFDDNNKHLKSIVPIPFIKCGTHFRLRLLPPFPPLIFPPF